VKWTHRLRHLKIVQSTKTNAIAENLRTKDDENDGGVVTVDDTHAQDRTTWRLCPDFLGDHQSHRRTGVFEFVCRVNSIFGVAKAEGHLHCLFVAVAAASDTPLERPEDNSLDRKIFDEQDSELSGYRGWRFHGVEENLEGEEW
jgi:hypothetical protein